MSNSQPLDAWSVLDSLAHGVTITDHNGVIIYYNEAQSRIDGLSQQEAIGRHITEVYVPALENSPTLTVLRTRQPIYNLFQIYETHKGTVINSTHTVLPLFKDGRIDGCLCLIQPIRPAKEQEELNRTALDAIETVQFGNLIGSSHIFRSSINSALTAADSPSSVLIYGETGSGKGLLARQLHEHSQRSAKPYVAINCSAIPASLLEGTLFGSVRGAFTGAQNNPGLFEEADGGTIYLDEVDSMPLELQPKLLQVIQERKVRRVGSVQEQAVDIKIISSFSGDPLEAVRGGRVRADLFYRLGVVIVQIPPLRERISDLPGLVSFFMNKHMAILKRKNIAVSLEVMSAFKSYSWPGNVRELENAIEGALNIIRDGETIGLSHLPGYLHKGGAAIQPPTRPMPIMDRHDYGGALPRLGYGGSASAPPADAEPAPGAPPPAALNPPRKARRSGRDEIVAALHLSNGSLKEAAAHLGISRQLLAYRLKKYGLNRDEF